jgi:hypothetical protein
MTEAIWVKQLDGTFAKRHPPKRKTYKKRVYTSEGAAKIAARHAAKREQRETVKVLRQEAIEASRVKIGQIKEHSATSFSRKLQPLAEPVTHEPPALHALERRLEASRARPALQPADMDMTPHGNTSHGHACENQTKTYRTHTFIKMRCMGADESRRFSPPRQLHPRWYKFKDFLADMGEQPEDHVLRLLEGCTEYSPGTAFWRPRHEPALGAGGGWTRVELWDTLSQLRALKFSGVVVSATDDDDDIICP